MNQQNPQTQQEKINNLEARIDHIKKIQSSAEDRKIRYNDLAHRVTFLKKNSERQQKIVKRRKVAEDLQIEASNMIIQLESELLKLRQENKQ